ALDALGACAERAGRELALERARRGGGRGRNRSRGLAVGRAGCAVRTVEVTGAHHMTARQVAGAAGVSGGGSIISIDGQSAEQRLLSQVWIRAATVQPQLPGTVIVQVSE